MRPIQSITTVGLGLLAVPTTPGLAFAALIDLNGLAQIGTDIRQPPAGYTNNVFYDFRDLSKPGNTSGSLSSNGWGTLSWAFSVGEALGKINFGASTREGQQVGGSLVGRSHADFAATFSLTENYKYTATVAGSVSGVHVGSGMLLHGPHTLLGKSLGNNAVGGVSATITLAPYTTSFEDVVEKSLQKNLKIDLGKPTKTAVFDTMAGAGLTLTQAAELGGYIGFNWLQVATHSDKPLPGPNGEIRRAPYLDPAYGGSQNHWNDDLPYFWDQKTDKSNPLYDPRYQLSNHYTYLNSEPVALNFDDTPYAPFAKGEHKAFDTFLVGIRSNQDFDLLDGFSWKTNYDKRNGNGAVFEALSPDDFIDTNDLIDPLLPVGGVFDVSDIDISDLRRSEALVLANAGAKNVVVPAPEPASLILLLSGLFAMAGASWLQRFRPR